MASLPPTDFDFANMPSGADPEERWAYISRAVEHIMTDPELRVSSKGYSGLYTAVYDYCRPGTKGQGFLNANLAASDLYNKLSLYFISHLKGITGKANTLEDIDLLQYYTDEWSRYTQRAIRLDRLFSYLNRFWVDRERQEDRTDVYHVSTLALVQWKTHLLMRIQESKSKLSNAVLRMITQQRNGEDVDEDLIKKVVDSFVSLGLDNADPDKECLEIYKEQFEAAFLSATESYYRKESKEFLDSHSVSDYLKKVEDRLREEEDRVGRYLRSETREELISKCVDVLIREHADKLMSARLVKDEDIQRMNALRSRIPEGLGTLSGPAVLH